MTGFSEHYKCPHILISTVGATSWVATVTGNPSPLSYIPHAFLDLTDKMTLLQRLQNTVFHLVETVLMNLFYYGKQQEIYETDFLTSPSFRPFWDKVKHGVSIVREYFQFNVNQHSKGFFIVILIKVFLNSHYTLSFARPYLPNLVSCSYHSPHKTH